MPVPGKAFGDATSVTSRQVSTRPEKLLDILAFNATAGVLYVQLHETTTTPADGVTPKLSFPVQSMLGGTLGREIDVSAVYICWSSTALTKTLAGASGFLIGVLQG